MRPKYALHYGKLFHNIMPNDTCLYLQMSLQHKAFIMTNFAASTGHFIPNGGVLRTRTLHFMAMCHNIRPKDTCLNGKWCNIRIRTLALIRNGAVTKGHTTLVLKENDFTA